jgi:dihydrofolate reductase
VTNPYQALASFVFSRTLERSPDPNVNLTSADPAAVARDLKGRPGKAIWLCGGAELAAALFSAGLVERLIVKLNPVVFGMGIPLLGRETAGRPLTLTESQVYPSGHALLQYRVG